MLSCPAPQPPGWLFLIEDSTSPPTLRAWESPAPPTALLLQMTHTSSSQALNASPAHLTEPSTVSWTDGDQMHAPGAMPPPPPPHVLLFPFPFPVLGLKPMHASTLTLRYTSHQLPSQKLGYLHKSYADLCPDSFPRSASMGGCVLLGLSSQSGSPPRCGGWL